MAKIPSECAWTRKKYAESKYFNLCEELEAKIRSHIDSCDQCQELLVDEENEPMTEEEAREERDLMIEYLRSFKK